MTLLSEILPRALLEELGLAKILLGSSGGGQFLAIIPLVNRDQAEAFLQSAAAQVDSLSEHHLSFIWAFTENLGSWTDIRKRLARYRELRPVFYVPGPERKLCQEGKPGHYVFVDGTPEQHALVTELTQATCRAAYAAYRTMLEAGVAREVARIVLPLTLYSSMYVTMNARALMNFLSLRVQREDSTFPSYPQREIEMVAEQMETRWAELMPLTHAAFEAGGRVAP